jgi:drug/metabolite transporter (DMT)-like permease
MWLYFALGGYACLAVVAMLDKYILSKEKVSPIIFVFYSTIFLLPLGLAVPFLHPGSIPAFVWPIILTGGLMFVLSLGTLYSALQETEVSHTGPFIGALIPLFVLVFSQIFLGEQITSHQLIGIILLCLGSLLIAYQKSPHHKAWRYHINPAVLSAVLFSLFHICAKYIYVQIGFVSGFILLWSVMGIIGLLIGLFSKKVQHHFFPKHPLLAAIRFRLTHAQTSSYEGLIVGLDKVLGAIGVFAVQYAVSLGSVTMVNALSGVQYGLLIIFVALASAFFPRLFKEKYNKGELVQEIFAVMVVILGIFFLVR